MAENVFIALVQSACPTPPTQPVHSFLLIAQRGGPSSRVGIPGTTPTQVLGEPCFSAASRPAGPCAQPGPPLSGLHSRVILLLINKPAWLPLGQGLSVGVVPPSGNDGPLAVSQGLSAPSPSCRRLPSPQRGDGQVTSPLRCAGPAQPAALGRVSSGCGPSSVTQGPVGATRAAGDTFAGSSHHRRRRAPPAAESPGTRAWGPVGRLAQYPRSGPVFQPVLHSARAAPGDAVAAKSPAPPRHTGTRRRPHAAACAAAAPASCAPLAPPQAPAGGSAGGEDFKGTGGGGGAYLHVRAGGRPQWAGRGRGFSLMGRECQAPS